MDRGPLHGADIARGQRRIAVLRRNGFPVDADFLLHEDEAFRWRVMIAASRANDPLNVSGEIVGLVHELEPSEQVADIASVSPTSPDQRNLRGLPVQDDDEVADGFHLDRKTHNGVRLNEAYVYPIAASRAECHRPL